ncbi:unnamed protein product, partial [Callosobruchus maculatus]
MNTYKIPANCKALIPPILNSEIQACLPKSALDHDSFLMALQEQIAHGLSAVGTVLGKMLPIPEQAEDLKVLADGCQLISNVHHAISTHRKFKIIPYLNTDCKKVAKTMHMDEFLFSRNFAEAVKNEQSIKKTSFTFKKKTIPAYGQAGPSGGPSSYLNSQRPPYKEKLKQKREGRPFDRHQQKTKRFRK